jgi:hypothetical protein
MKRPFFLVVAMAALTLQGPARADGSAEAPPPDPVLAGVVGAATAFAGFAIGGTVMGVTGDNSPASMAGWLTMEGGFALAPFTAHAVVGEWGRGALFAAIPAATTLGSVPVFLYNEAAVVHGTLPQQRWMYIFMCAGILASSIGVIDAVLAPRRGLQVAPIIGAGNYGLSVGGFL